MNESVWMWTCLRCVTGDVAADHTCASYERDEHYQCCARGETLQRNGSSAGSDIRSATLGGARRERVNAQTAGLDPVNAERSPA